MTRARRCPAPFCSSVIQWARVLWERLLAAIATNASNAIKDAIGVGEQTAPKQAKVRAEHIEVQSWIRMSTAIGENHGSLVGWTRLEAEGIGSPY